MKKALCLISSGIDSPVAAAIMIDKLNISFIHFENNNEKSLQKVKKQIQKLSNKLNKKLELFVVPHKNNQIAYMENCNTRFQCVFCKRTMFRIAEKLANRENIDYLLSGENIGQVASQTVENMITENSAIDIVVLRPLLAMDKNDIIKIAREIDTYETSIEKDPGCFALPKNPTTKSTVEKIEREELKIDVKSLIENSLNGTQKFTFTPF